MKSSLGSLDAALSLGNLGSLGSGSALGASEGEIKEWGK
ncbi:hypothetical protein CLCOL_09850 [Clostridium colicanis DSM 13634]|uniref:Uncharacterized protein n=1 Tax=Clostridium colicanis DSM 13634 TaxID=1121305 RepID=A0A151ANQ0_9CLOT|nr:hypothetical protein CLCOL_09850 [Clostridium colicanis DSM 13634]